MNKPKKIKLDMKNFKQFASGIAYFYRFDYENVSYEVALEPCTHGFDVALYRRHPKFDAPRTVTPKKCTCLDGYSEDTMKTKPRGTDAWTIALEKAQKIVDRFFNDRDDAKERYSL